MSASDVAVVEGALEGIRNGFRVDGADLVVDDVEGGTATVRLVVGPDTCQECILPRSILERVVLAAVQKVDDRVTSLHLIDPRETNAETTVPAHEATTTGEES